MKAAIIGLGVIGKVHYEVLKKAGVEIVLCDIDADKLSHFNEPKKYTDYKEMLSSEQVDVVHICTPHYLHAEMVIYALNNGQNVLCEKPLCIKREQIDAILEAEKAAKGILGVCFQNRYNNSSRFIKSYLSDKNVTFADGILRWHRDAAYYATAEWRGKWATEGGGVLINQAIHTLDLLLWILGMPDKVEAKTAQNSLAGIIEVEDTADCVFYGHNDFSLFATNTSKVDRPVELRFVANNERIIVTPDFVSIEGKKVDIDTECGYYGKVSYGNGHEKLIADFYDCVRSGKKFDIDGTEGAKAVKLVLAAYQSDGQKIDIQ